MSEETTGRTIEEEKEPLITREAVGTRFRAIGKALRNIPRPTILHIIILALVLAMAGIVRLLPLRWGPFVSEFDPYFNLNDMRHLTANGWLAWYSYTDPTAWFPFGRAPVTTSYPGTSFTGTLFYQFLQTIGISLGPNAVYAAAVYVPVVLGVFAVLVTYFFAKDIWGRSTGLFAALFAAFNSSLISRTDLGFFRNEGVGIPTMILTFLFFLRAINPQRSLKGTIVYSMLSSISLIYMSFSWGSFRYAAEVIGLFTLALVLLRRYTPRLFLSYGLTIGFFLYTGTSIPDLGHTFLTESTTIALLGVMGLLVIMELAKLAPTTRGRLTIAGVFGAAIAGGGYFIATTNFLSTSLGSKFLTTLDPFLRNNIPLVASVAENRPSTWASFFLELGSILLLGVFGFFFAFQRLRDADVLLIIFGTTAFYFAASLVRLTLVLGPAISTLAAITVVELGKPAMDIIQQSVIYSRRKLRFTTRVSREFSIGILVIILILIIPSFIAAVQSAYTPVTIASSSLPIRASVGDWLQTLAWMNNNLPSTSVVFAWWDYGYWISYNTGLHTLADNGTGNLTQIQNIATGFLLNESQAVHLLQKYGVTHVAVFASYDSGPAACGTGQAPLFCGYGEDSKWYWMARIGNGTLVQTPAGQATVTFTTTVDTTTTNPTTIYHRRITINKQTSDEIITTQVDSAPLPASNTLLGLLLRSGYPGGIPTAAIQQRGYTDIGSTTTHFFTKLFGSSNSYVQVYSVNYPTPTLATVRLNPAVVSRNALKTNITGTLTNAITGQGIATTTSATSITLEDSIDNGNTWNIIQKLNSTQTGDFASNCTGGANCINNWTPPSLPAGQSVVLVRARWGGDAANNLDIAVSAPARLVET
jgi:dolichyl-diphosphooligosaccharide---protein glycosyltransferase